ncbi:hypothetical protein OSB04_014950 [Centaurea solstitialis]|uniref:CCHC-type domain-containing protein n=1 Tax=Centaurea solstitialis TaxID=347529 RepID=A0AA38SY17_9ASTR|nr:hypothetical protein OSB04_014950 [Centaurea solstitialis]
MTDPSKRARDGTEPCYKCGIVGHWYKHCRASNDIVATYKRYRESKEQETHYLEETNNDPEANLTITDFTNIDNDDSSLELSDFD